MAPVCAAPDALNKRPASFRKESGAGMLLQAVPVPGIFKNVERQEVALASIFHVSCRASIAGTLQVHRRSDRKHMCWPA